MVCLKHKISDRLAQQQVIQLKKDLLKAKYDTLMSVLKIRTALGQNSIDLF
jgi:hypothetical protein